MIRIVLPYHLRTLARVQSEVLLQKDGITSLKAALDALEEEYPVLRGTIREHSTLKRRPFIRFYACKEDLSHVAPEAPLPEAVLKGEEPLLVVGAMAGG
jgi:sulfur-carrier protein